MAKAVAGAAKASVAARGKREAALRARVKVKIKKRRDNRRDHEMIRRFTQLYVICIPTATSFVILY